MVGAPACLRHALHTRGDQYGTGTYTDEWGCVFTNIQRGVIGEVKEPLIKTWDDLDKLLYSGRMIVRQYRPGGYTLPEKRVFYNGSLPARAPSNAYNLSAKATNLILTLPNSPVN